MCYHAPCVHLHGGKVLTVFFSVNSSTTFPSTATRTSSRVLTGDASTRAIRLPLGNAVVGEIQCGIDGDGSTRVDGGVPSLSVIEMFGGPLNCFALSDALKSSAACSSSNAQVSKPPSFADEEEEEEEVSTSLARARSAVLTPSTMQVFVMMSPSGSAASTRRSTTQLVDPRGDGGGEVPSHRVRLLPTSRGVPRPPGA